MAVDMSELDGPMIAAFGLFILTAVLFVPKILAPLEFFQSIFLNLIFSKDLSKNLKEFFKKEQIYQTHKKYVSKKQPNLSPFAFFSFCIARSNVFFPEPSPPS